MKRMIAKRLMSVLAAGFLALTGPMAFTQARAQAPDQVRLQLESRGPGRLDWNGQGSGLWQVDKGEKITVKVLPDEGARLKTLERNGQPEVPENQRLTFTAEKDTVILAVFEQDKPDQGSNTAGTEENRQESGEPDDSLSEPAQKEQPGQDAGKLNLPADRPFALTAEESAIIDRYLHNDFAAGREQREAMVKEYGLQDWVDKEFFLLPAWFDAFGMHAAARGGMQILNCNAAGFTQTARARTGGTVTKLDTHYWYYSGGYMTGGQWTVDVPGFGSCIGYCANGLYSAPEAGTPLEEPVLRTDSMMRKALYYGYAGPQNRLAARGWNDALQVIVTNDLVSMANIGNSIGGTIGGGWIWRDYSGKVWEEMKSWPEPPATFRVYLADTVGSGQDWLGNTKPYQPLAFFVDNPQGTFRLTKTDRLPDLTQDNQAYSLEGAEYTVYDTAGKKAGTLVTDKNGNTGEIQLPLGTYTCRETKAPAGYQKDPAAYTVVIDRNGSSVSTSATVQDVPESTLVELLLLKKGESGQPLGGAQFEITFHKNGETAATRRWVMETDARGKILMDNAHKVSGDAFFLNEQGKPCFPKGEVKIRETKAPAGYRLNDQVQTVATAGLTLWKAPEIANTPLNLVLEKKQAGTGVLIPGTVFERTGPDGSTETKTTDGSGRLTFEKLKPGEHVIREISSVPGYKPLEKEIRITVTDRQILAEGKPLADGNVVSVENTPEDHNLKLIKKSSAGPALEGARFALYEDESCTKRVFEGTTGKDGVLEIPGMENGKAYWLKETAAPAGYRPDPMAVKLVLSSVPAENRGTVEVNGTVYKTPCHQEMIQAQMNDGSLQAVLVRINQAGSILPETGSAGTLKLMALAAALLALAWFVNRKDEQ